MQGKKKKKCILFWKPSPLTTQTTKPFSSLSLQMHVRWRMTTLNDHLMAPSRVFTLQHSGQLHSLATKKLNFKCKMSEITFTACVQCYLMSYLDRRAHAGPYRAMPILQKSVHGCRSEGGFQAWFREKQKKRKHSRQKLNFYSNSRNRTKTKGCQIQTGLPLPQSGALNITQGGGEASFQSKPPETLQTLFCDTLISPTKNSELGPTEAVSGARCFLWNKQHRSASANRAGLPEGSSI